MLKINSIFESISGEAGGFPQGTWTTFIRLQGCNLRCHWCDTPQAQNAKEPCPEMNIPNILMKMVQIGGGRNKHVLITGGEPLLQSETVYLIETLLAFKFIVQVETNGSIPLPEIPMVNWVVDRKGMSSGVAEKMIALSSFAKQIQRVKAIGSRVYIKWVVSDDEDVDFMIQEAKELIYLGTTTPFIISPVDADGSKISSIVKKIKEKNRSLLENITFSVQLHKICKMF
ncbi:MAG: 7-carboxy-7-deazaguanine synthase QueE [Sphaerochaetaceae bacterium]